MWKCSKCGESVEDSFEVCWSCGTSVDGVQDPHFMVQTPGAEGRLDPAQEWQENEVPEKLVTITSCSLPPEALAIRLQLEAAGIPVFLADEYTVTMDWLLSNAIGGIKVQVAETDVERALAILSQARDDKEDRETQEEEDDAADDE